MATYTNAAAKKPFKVNQKVNFTSRSRRGVGKIIAIKSGLTGDYYSVRYDGDNVVSVRASQLSAA